MAITQQNVARAALIALEIGSDAADNLEWPVFTNKEPSGPDNCITIYGTRGIVFGRLFETGEVPMTPGLQFRIRGVDNDVAEDKGQEIMDALDSLYRMLVTVGVASVRIQGVHRQGNLMCLSQDEKNRRSTYVLNALVTYEVL